MARGVIQTNPLLCYLPTCPLALYVVRRECRIPRWTLQSSQVTSCASQDALCRRDGLEGNVCVPTDVLLQKPPRYLPAETNTPARPPPLKLRRRKGECRGESFSESHETIHTYVSTYLTPHCFAGGCRPMISPCVGPDGQRLPPSSTTSDE